MRFLVVKVLSFRESGIVGEAVVEKRFVNVHDVKEAKGYGPNINDDLSPLCVSIHKHGKRKHER